MIETAPAIFTAEDPSGTHLVPVGRLRPSPSNPRIITDLRFQSLCASIQADPQFLWERPILATPDGVVYAGNMRLRAAMHLGLTEVPARFADLTERQAKERALKDNNGWGEWQDDELAQMLYELEQDHADLPQLGFTDKELGSLRALWGGDGSESDPPETDDLHLHQWQEKWQVQPSDVWTIPSVTVGGGSHRLLCGDATDRDDVAALFLDQRAEMVWTDPPYGVAIGDKNKFLNAIAPSNRIEENLAGDEVDEDVLQRMVAAFVATAVPFCLPGAAWYVTGPAGPPHLIFGKVLKDHGIWRQTIQWVKNSATFAPMGVDYHWQAEPMFYGWLPDAGHRYYGGRQQTTVWEIDRPSRSPDHPTMKPVPLVTRSIKNSSLPGQIVYDPFVGSGTTLEAAEITGRLAYAIEIDPKYVATSLERISVLGLMPTRIA